MDKWKPPLRIVHVDKILKLNDFHLLEADKQIQDIETLEPDIDSALTEPNEQLEFNELQINSNQDQIDTEALVLSDNQHNCHRISFHQI